MIAELSYLFRHAILRDAAYQLQLPSDRSLLHALAFAAIEDAAGGRPQGAAPLDATEPASFQAHFTDPFAEELAEHARLAGGASSTNGDAMSAAWKLYLRRAAELSERSFHHGAAERLWRQHASAVEGVEKGESLRMAANAAHQAGRTLVAERLL
ncbi:MAG: hypothetical protein FD180_4368, partial [Planctomycetota bacterium]